jgi:hypothetical protein
MASFCTVYFGFSMGGHLDFSCYILPHFSIIYWAAVLSFLLRTKIISCLPYIILMASSIGITVIIRACMFLDSSTAEHIEFRRPSLSQPTTSKFPGKVSKYWRNVMIRVAQLTPLKIEKNNCLESQTLRECLD